MIQIDEPALREGLPLRAADWDEYLAWAVECFRLASSGVADETQIHSHMCYSDFNDIIPAIARSTPTSSRSRRALPMELLDAFKSYGYPNEIGPGVYDIHSPRVPGVHEIKLLIASMAGSAATSSWSTPTAVSRPGWKEVVPALEHLVEAARRRRSAQARLDCPRPGRSSRHGRVRRRWAISDRRSWDGARASPGAGHGHARRGRQNRTERKEALVTPARAAQRSPSLRSAVVCERLTPLCLCPDLSSVAG